MNADSGIHAALAERMPVISPATKDAKALRTSGHENQVAAHRAA